MEKYFVTYPQSLALKELGFNEPCMGVYYGDVEDIQFTLNVRETQYYAQKGYKNGVLAPLKSQAFEFFREKYGYDVTIKKITKDKYQFIIELICVEDTSYHFVDYYFDSYNEAELSCIDKLIKIVKNK